MLFKNGKLFRKLLRLSVNNVSPSFRFDVDNAGIVQTKDIHKSLKAMLTPLTAVEISDIIKSMDRSLAGTIEYFTFLKTLETHEI